MFKRGLMDGFADHNGHIAQRVCASRVIGERWCKQLFLFCTLTPFAASANDYLLFSKGLPRQFWWPKRRHVILRTKFVLKTTNEHF